MQKLMRAGVIVKPEEIVFQEVRMLISGKMMF